MGNVMESQERVFDLRGVEGTPRLSIQHLNGEIHIHTWDRPEIRVRIDEDDCDIDDVFQMQQHDNEVVIGLEWSPEQYRGKGRAMARQIEEAVRGGDFSSIGENIGAFFGRMMGPRPDVDAEITVPAACDVAIRTVTGGVEVEGVTGNIYLESASGDMNLVQVAGNLIGKSASGGFEAEGFNGRLGLRTASGNVEIRGGLLKAFNIGTISGDVQLSGHLAPDGEYAIQTTSGDAELAVPDDTHCTVKIRTVSGDVECELPFERQREGRRRMILDINGGGPVIQFGSVSGDLQIAGLGSGKDVAAVDVDVPVDHDGEPGATQRLRRDDAPYAGGGEESFRVAGEGGRTTGPLTGEAGPPRPSAEMSVLEAIERGEMSVDEGLAKLAELRQDFS